MDLTPLDFRKPTALGERIHDEFLGVTGGYDHTFVLKGEGMRKCAVLTAEGVRLSMECHTDRPALQLYTANHLAGELGVNASVYGKYAGVALETQNFPDSPNKPQFPSAILRAGEVFASETKYIFRRL